MHNKLTDNKSITQRMSRWRKSTVEPVLGTLINFLNMRRVNTRGIKLANKHVLMAALCYNLKKYLKFITKKAVPKAISLQTELQSAFLFCFSFIWLIFRRCKPELSKIENSQSHNNFSLKTSLYSPVLEHIGKIN
jgi:hypothetical protein